MPENAHPRRRRRLAPAAVVAGLLGAVVLSLSLTGTLSAFTASINNSTDTVTAGSVVMQETDGTNTCTSTDSPTNAATCTTINKYGGPTARLVPGGSSTKTVTLANLGSVTPAAFTLTPGACSQSGSVTGLTAATDFCAQVNLRLYAAATATGTPIFNGPLSTFNAAALTLAPLAPAASQPYTFVVSLPSTLGNTYQNLTASQPMTWAFTS